MELRKRFYVALAIYAALGLAIWLTVGDVPIPVGAFVPFGGRGTPQWLDELFQKQITVRQMALAVWALFVVRTFLHWRAEEIRAERGQEQNQVSS